MAWWQREIQSARILMDESATATFPGGNGHPRHHPLFRCCAQLRLQPQAVSACGALAVCNPPQLGMASLCVCFLLGALCCCAVPLLPPFLLVVLSYANPSQAHLDPIAFHQCRLRNVPVCPTALLVPCATVTPSCNRHAASFVTTASGSANVPGMGHASKQLTAAAGKQHHGAVAAWERSGNSKCMWPQAHNCAASRSPCLVGQAQGTWGSGCSRRSGHSRAVLLVEQQVVGSAATACAAATGDGRCWWSSRHWRPGGTS